MENVMAALEAAVEKLPGKWKGIKALYLKTAESVALPVYQAEVVPEVDAAAADAGTTTAAADKKGKKGGK